MKYDQHILKSQEAYDAAARPSNNPHVKSQPYRKHRTYDTFKKTA